MHKLHQIYVMSSSQHQHKDEAPCEAATCEATLALTQDFSRPATLARVPQPSTLTSALGLPLFYLRAGTLSAKLLLSGGVAGAISRTATAPIDRLKFLLQVQDTQLITIRQVQDWPLSVVSAAGSLSHCSACHKHRPCQSSSCTACTHGF